MVYQIMGILRYHKLDVLSIEMPCLMIQKCFILSLVRHILKTVFSKISTTYLIELIGMVVAVSDFHLREQIRWQNKFVTGFIYQNHCPA